MSIHHRTGLEKGAAISVDEFRRLNQCLDDAIASAVTEYARDHPTSLVDAGAMGAHERFGFLAHELRNLVNTATVAFEVLNRGNVGVRGSTGAVLKRSLVGLGDLINRSVTEVRLRQDVQDRVHIDVAELIEELAPAAALQAAGRGLQFTVQSGEADVAVLCRPPDSFCGGHEPAAERVQVHPAFAPAWA